MKKYFVIGLSLCMAALFFSCAKTTASKKKNIQPVVQVKTEKYAVKDSSKVQDLGGGLKMYMIEEGRGDKPLPTSTVTINYHGMLFSNGMVFDSSFDRGQPATFALQQLIEGWKTALPQVKKGSKIKLIVPPALGYGANANGAIPANSTLVFDIELIDFK